MYQLADLSIKELLSLTVKESAATEILAQFPTIREIASSSIEELTTAKGIGPLQAKKLLASIELGRRLYSFPAEQITTIRCPQDVYHLLFDMQALDREYFKVINLSTKNHVLSVSTVSMGTLNASPVHCREVYRLAIRQGAAAIICAHCHPSGDPTPSREDEEVTKRLAEAGKLLGIELFDHVIIGHGKYVSLKERGVV